MKNRKLLALPIIASAVLAGCSNDNGDDKVATPVAEYQISMTNLTHAQPLSPVGFVFHESGYRAWVGGQPASVELEQMAEGGEAMPLIDQAMAHDKYLAYGLNQGILPPGASSTITVPVFDVSDDTRLSGFTMLVNTNDAFTGLNNISLASLQTGDSVSYRTNVYDAGTEKNTEAAGTIPGPADSSENKVGFSADRDDFNDQVTLHPGVVSADDGLTGSVLTQAHRFDNPALSIKITRIR